MQHIGGEAAMNVDAVIRNRQRQPDAVVEPQPKGQTAAETVPMAALPFRNDKYPPPKRSEQHQRRLGFDLKFC